MDIQDKKGFTSIVIILVILAIVALGGSILFINTKKPNLEESTATEMIVTNDETETDSDLSFSGTYFDTIEKGSPLECDWSAPEGFGPNQIGQGKLYTDGNGNGRTEAVFSVANANANTYAIFMNETVYQWTELPSGQKIGIKITKEDAQASEDNLTDEEKEQGKQYASQYSFSCKPWAIDTTMFELPDDVEFSEVSSLTS